MNFQEQNTVERCQHAQVEARTNPSVLHLIPGGTTKSFRTNRSMPYPIDHRQLDQALVLRAVTLQAHNAFGKYNHQCCKKN
eukprot:4514862-Pleurochrysis_carterae.AAC.1